MPFIISVVSFSDFFKRTGVTYNEMVKYKKVMSESYLKSKASKKAASIVLIRHNNNYSLKVFVIIYACEWPYLSKSTYNLATTSENDIGFLT